MKKINLEILKKLAKSNSILAAGTTGGLGFAIAGGTCAAGVCSIAAFPLVTFLSTIGLGAITPWLPALRIPLLAIALLLGVLVIRNVNRQHKPVKSAAVGAVLGGLFVFSILQAFQLQREEPTPNQEHIRQIHCRADHLREPMADFLNPWEGKLE